MSPRTPTSSEVGASAVEYSLIVAAIAAIIVVIVFAVGKLSAETYADTCDSLDRVSALSTATDCP